MHFSRFIALCKIDLINERSITEIGWNLEKRRKIKWKIEIRGVEKTYLRLTLSTEHYESIKYQNFIKLADFVSRQFYIGVNSKCPENFLPIFLLDAATKAKTWGTDVTPYSRRRL